MIILCFIVLIFGLNNVLSYSLEDLDLSVDEIKHYLATRIHEHQIIDNLNENIFTPYLFDSGVGNRERLIVNNIFVDESFSFGKDMLKWNEITFGGWQYLIGQKEHSVTMIQIKSKHFTSEKFNTLFFNETIMYFEGVVGPIVLIEHINYTSQLKEGFALVTESTKEHFQNIHWLKITRKGLVTYDIWSNPTRGEIIDLKWVKHDFTEYLVITTRQDDNFTTVDISEYKLQNDKMRLMCKDKIQVKYQVSSVSLVVEGEDLFMALVTPLEQRVWLYRYSLDFYKTTGFETLWDFYSPKVTKVDAFTQSGRHYFITNGDEPNIYLLNRGGKLSSQLHHCGQVEEWLVLKVPTYREDVVLLARNQESVSMLTWMGSLQGFNVMNQPPCFSIDSDMKNINRISGGAECVARCRWSGGAVLSLSDIPSLLLSCKTASDSGVVQLGGLYHFNISLHPVQGPAHEILHMLSRTQQIQDEATKLSEVFIEEGLLDDIDISQVRLELNKDWADSFNDIEQCIASVEHHISLLSSYVNLRRQNNVRVDMTFHRGKLSGSASGIFLNETLATNFEGRLRWHPQEDSKFDRNMILESKVLLDGQPTFNIKSLLRFNTFEVTGIPSDEEMRSSNSNFGISPEIRGQPHGYTKDELPLHHRMVEDNF